MFEKEAQSYEEKAEFIEINDYGKKVYDSMDIQMAYQKGATFAYNKANEWNFVKDKLPPSGEIVLLYFGTDIMGKAIMSTGCVDCKGNWYKNVDGEPIEWQEIVLPKESE